MSQITTDVKAWLDGKTTTDDLAAKWAAEDWKPVPGTDLKPTTGAEVYDHAEDDNAWPFEDGTWGEVDGLWADGTIPSDKYAELSAAVDKAVAARKA